MRMCVAESQKKSAKGSNCKEDDRALPLKVLLLYGPNSCLNRMGRAAVSRTRGGAVTAGRQKRESAIPKRRRWRQLCVAGGETAASIGGARRRPAGGRKGVNATATADLPAKDWGTEGAVAGGRDSGGAGAGSRCPSRIGEWRRRR